MEESVFEIDLNFIRLHFLLECLCETENIRFFLDILRVDDFMYCAEVLHIVFQWIKLGLPLVLLRCMVVVDINHSLHMHIVAKILDVNLVLNPIHLR